MRSWFMLSTTARRSMLMTLERPCQQLPWDSKTFKSSYFVVCELAEYICLPALLMQLRSNLVAVEGAFRSSIYVSLLAGVICISLRNTSFNCISLFLNKAVGCRESVVWFPQQQIPNSEVVTRLCHVYVAR